MSEKQENNQSGKNPNVIEMLESEMKPVFEKTREEFRNNPKYVSIEDIDDEYFEDFMAKYKDELTDNAVEELKDKKDLIMYLVALREMHFFEKGYQAAFIYLADMIKLAKKENNTPTE